MNTIRDFVLPVASLPDDATSGVVLSELDRRNVRYGIILDVNNRPLGLVTRNQIAALDANATIALTALVVIVDANATIEELASFSGVLIGSPAILVRDNGKIIGVFEAETLAKHIASTSHTATRSTELAGTPRTPFLYWICRKCREEYPVIEYRRTDPPRCPKDGTLLKQPR
jgi:predicted transcriptional regulator